MALLLDLQVLESEQEAFREILVLVRETLVLVASLEEAASLVVLLASCPGGIIGDGPGGIIGGGCGIGCAGCSIVSKVLGSLSPLSICLIHKASPGVISPD